VVPHVNLSAHCAETGHLVQSNLDQIPLRPGWNLLLKDVDSTAFETLMAESGDKRTAQVSYSGGMLGIMTPLAVHENDKERIGDLIKLFLEKRGMERGKNWTDLTIALPA